MKVVIVGSGNVATVIGRQVSQSGHEVVQVISKTAGHAAELAGLLQAKASRDISAIDPSADICMLMVPDDQIGAIAPQIRLNNCLLVHTAGSVAINVLRGSAERYGVLYPLQSLRKEMTCTPEIPVLVNGNEPGTTTDIRAFAETWATSVTVASDEERLKTHIAAVIASNFSNHLYALTEAYCRSENISFPALIPLIVEIGSRLRYFNPGNVQTGPAARGDKSTVEKHITMLASHPSLQAMYTFMTDSIKDFRKE